MHIGRRSAAGDKAVAIARKYGVHTAVIEGTERNAVTEHPKDLLRHIKSDLSLATFINRIGK